VASRLVNPGMAQSPHLHQVCSSSIPAHVRIKDANRCLRLWGVYVPWLLATVFELNSGQNAFNTTMDPKNDIPTAATCTTCTFAEDFSNYWTAVLYFQARNRSLIRVPLRQNVGFEQAVGGMTVYYSPPTRGSKKVTAFRPVRYRFRPK
jgi:hypothetical protein